MTINITEYIYDNWTNRQKPYKHYSVTGENETECFKKIYTGYVRPIRYCSGYSITCDDAEQDQRFREWQKHGVTIEMFYGNGTVD